MPAPPYSCGTEMPSSPSFAMPPRMRSRSKWCFRSFSRMNGATFCAPHSRMDCSRRWCSSFRLKSIMVAHERAWNAEPAKHDIFFASFAAFAFIVGRQKRRIVSRAAGDVHGRAASQIEARGGARAVGGDFQVVGAAEQRAHLAGGDVGIGRHDPWHGMAADADVERAV